MAFKFWPSHFTTAAVIKFFMFEHDGMPRTGVSYLLGCEISETEPFCACPSPKNTGLFLIFCIAAEFEFSRLHFLPQLLLVYEHGPVFRIWQQLADLPRLPGDKLDQEHMLTNFVRACIRFSVMGVPIFLGTHCNF
jgi:hypothetical protein